MSALSCCVTCGIAFHACDEVLRRLAADVAHRLALDLAPLGEIGQRRRPARAGAAAARRARCRTNACTSSTLMRPSGPVPGTWRISTPSSRASRRTDGRRGRRGPLTAAGSLRCGAGAAAHAVRRDRCRRLRRAVLPALAASRRRAASVRRSVRQPARRSCRDPVRPRPSARPPPDVGVTPPAAPGAAWLRPPASAAPAGCGLGFSACCCLSRRPQTCRLRRRRRRCRRASAPPGRP